MGSKNSWRLLFVDVDSSFSISTEAGTIKGYMVARAPKGETSPYFFDKGNAAAIHAMLGVPNANWPDLYEAEAFNKEYGLYISAPAGSSKKNPSTFGGVYVTSEGLKEFKNVTSKESIDFTSVESVTFNKSDISYAESMSNETLKENTIQLKISLEAEEFRKTSKVFLNYWGDDKNGIQPGIYTYILNKTDNKIYLSDDEGKEIKDFVCGKISQTEAGRDILLGCNSDATNTADNKNCPLLNFNNIISNIQEYCTSGLGNGIWTDFTAAFGEGNVNEYLNKQLTDQTTFTGDTCNDPFTEGKEVISRNNDIKDSCFGYIVQKSPTTKATSITISNIGYDKWKYDYACPESDTSSGEKKLDFNTDDNLYISGDKLYSYNEVDKKSTDVTSLYETQYVAISSSTTPQNVGKIYYVGSEKLYECKEDDDKYPLIKDPKFNTMTFSVTEEVYPGKQTFGGEFTGSFEESGKDSYGANIFWPNVLNDDDMTYVEIKPVSVIETADNGWFNGTRIIDDKIKKIPSTLTKVVSGTRYVTSVVEENIKNGVVGGAWTPGFTSVVKEGWNEAFDSQYDDVYVFMDPTGQEDVHSEQAKLVETHKLAIAISPKIISKAEFLNPSKIIVKGRSRQCAQFVGEFQYYDSITGKNFWMMPIGDVGAMCCKIIDKKLGGWPPAWYNYQGLGGQIPRPILKARWNLSDKATEIMDKKGLNPIVFNADDGLMITSSKTTQDPNSLNDWSYLEHVMSFLLCKREIRDNVMRQQVKKPIDEYWMSVRQAQVDAILAKRISGPQKIWTSAVCDIAGQNNDVTRSQRKFVIKVQIKVTVFSEYVELIFENVAQTTQI